MTGKDYDAPLLFLLCTEQILVPSVAGGRVQERDSNSNVYFTGPEKLIEDYSAEIVAKAPKGTRRFDLGTNGDGLVRVSVGGCFSVSYYGRAQTQAKCKEVYTEKDWEDDKKEFSRLVKKFQPRLKGPTFPSTIDEVFDQMGR